MEQMKFQNADQLLEKLDIYRSIHIECNPETAGKIFQAVRRLEGIGKIGYIVHTDKGYERDTVKVYLKFWSEITAGSCSVDKVMERFELTHIARKKLRDLTLGEHMRLQFARISMQEAQIYYLEDPLLNLDSQGISKVLEWIEACHEAGIRFITTNVSLRHALLMPGTAFYLEQGRFCQVEQEEDGTAESDEDIRILKIAAKSGNNTLLFEPKDIDFVESMNKHNYISVRGTLFQVEQNMEEMEHILSKSGFYRCHRSYLVNMQKVEQIERLSKNSYALLLDNQEQSRIPLSKSRVGDMKETFGW